jgi:hypothetical protein
MSRRCRMSKNWACWFTRLYSSGWRTADCAAVQGGVGQTACSATCMPSSTRYSPGPARRYGEAESPPKRSVAPVL